MNQSFATFQFCLLRPTFEIQSSVRHQQNYPGKRFATHVKVDPELQHNLEISSIENFGKIPTDRMCSNCASLHHIISNKLGFKVGGGHVLLNNICVCLIEIVLIMNCREQTIYLIENHNEMVNEHQFNSMTKKTFCSKSFKLIGISSVSVVTRF